MKKQFWADRKALFGWLPKGGIGAELGVKNGESAQLLLDFARPKCFYLIDYWSLPKPHRPHMQPELKRREGYYQTTIRRFGKAIASGRVIVVRKTTVQAADALWAAAWDWIHIDAGMSYGERLKDYTLYYPRLKSGGLMLCRGYDPAIKGGATIAAVNSFLASHKDMELVGTTQEYSGTAVLRKNPT